MIDLYAFLQANSWLYLVAGVVVGLVMVAIVMHSPKGMGHR